MWRATVKPAESKGPYRPVIKSHDSAEKMAAFKPAPVKQTSKIFAGMTVYVHIPYGKQDIGFGLVHQITERGGRSVNEYEDPTITHMVINIPDSFEPNATFSDDDLTHTGPLDRPEPRWKMFIRKYAKFWNCETGEPDLKRNKGRCRKVYRAEWLAEVLSGKLDVSDEGDWGVWRRSYGRPEVEEGETSSAASESAVELVGSPEEGELLTPSSPRCSPPIAIDPRHRASSRESVTCIQETEPSTTSEPTNTTKDRRGSSPLSISASDESPKVRATAASETSSKRSVRWFETVANRQTPSPTSSNTSTLSSISASQSSRESPDPQLDAEDKGNRESASPMSECIHAVRPAEPFTLMMHEHLKSTIGDITLPQIARPAVVRLRGTDNPYRPDTPPLPPSAIESNLDHQVTPGPSAQSSPPQVMGLESPAPGARDTNEVGDDTEGYATPDLSPPKPKSPKREADDSAPVSSPEPVPKKPRRSLDSLVKLGFGPATAFQATSTPLGAPTAGGIEVVSSESSLPSEIQQTNTPEHQGSSSPLTPPPPSSPPTPTESAASSPKAKMVGFAKYSDGAASLTLKSDIPPILDNPRKTDGKPCEKSLPSPKVIITGSHAKIEPKLGFAKYANPPLGPSPLINLDIRMRDPKLVPRVPTKGPLAVLFDRALGEWTNSDDLKALARYPGDRSRFFGVIEGSVRLGEVNLGKEA